MRQQEGTDPAMGCKDDVARMASLWRMARTQATIRACASTARSQPSTLVLWLGEKTVDHGLELLGWQIACRRAVVFVQFVHDGERHPQALDRITPVSTALRSALL